MKKKLLFTFLSLLGLTGVNEATAQNMIIPDDPNIILEQPEGKLVYFEANCITQPYDDKEEFTLIIPTVFGEDGLVYMRNPIGEDSCYEVWIRGEIDPIDGSIVFPTGQPVACHYTQCYQEMNTKYIYLANKKEDDWYAYVFDIENPDNENIIFSRLPDGSYEFIKKGESSYIISSDKFFGSEKLPNYKTNNISEMILREIDFRPIEPPTDLIPETYQMTFDSYYDVLLNSQGYYVPMIKIETVGKLINIVVDGDDIYLQGLSTFWNDGDPNAWMKGYIEGDKVIFPIHQNLGVSLNSRPIVLSTIDIKITHEGDHNVPFTHIYFYGKDENLIFDYNKEEGILENPNLVFCFYDTPLQFLYIFVRHDYGMGIYIDTQLDLFKNLKLKKLPDKIQIPQIPQIVEENDPRLYPYSVYANYFDTDGYVMKTENLFLKIWKDGKPYTFTQEDFSNTKFNCQGNPLPVFPTMEFDPTDVLPFELLYNYLPYRIYECYYMTALGENNYRISLDFVPSDVELIYVKDGIEYSSKRNTDAVDSILIEEENHNAPDDIIYDLNGRIVNDNALIPGIYIRNGKKFVVKN